MDRKAYEPSMEEILASIRRIIADDQAMAEAPAAVVERPVERPKASVAAVPQPVVASPQPPAEPDEMVFVAPPPNGTPQAEATDNVASITPAAKMPAEPVVARGPVEVPSMPLRGSRPEWPGQGQVAPQAQPQIQPQMQPQAQPQANLAMANTPNPPAEPPRERREGPRARPVEPAANEEPLVSPATDQAVSNAFHALVASRFVPSSDVMAEMVRDMLRPMLKAWLDDNLPIMVERLVRAEIERVARGGR